MDVFIVPVEGGIPKRLTWHPGADFVRGFTPDGNNVLFASQRSIFTRRYAQLFTVSTKGGYPVQLEIPNAWKATYSPDGKYMAYTPISGRFAQWKNYRGGTVATIWVFSFEDHSIVKIPQPESSCNDTDPMWIENKIYFRSDRNGEFNLFSYDIASQEINQLTEFKDFPIISISHNNQSIIFEQSGYLHTYDINKTASNQLTVGIATDLLELRPRYVHGGDYIRSSGISSTGARVVFDYRGDIITVPAEKGDPRNITETTGAHEKYPAWSPDGKSIAYFSDESGEYQLHIKSQDGKNQAKKYNLSGTGFYAHIHWAPDSKKLCFVDNGRNLYVFDVESGSMQKIDTDELYVPGPFRDLFGDWSKDSKWISYNKVTETHFKRIYLYSIAEGKSYSLTDGLSDASDPVFDPSGKYLYFFASTDAGPVVNWFDQSTADMEMTSNIYLITLQKETISPFAKESDEEKLEEESSEETDTPKEEKKGKNDDNKDDEPIKIDFDGIQNRIVDIPIRAGNYSQLGVGKEGEILYVSRSFDL